MVAQVKTTDITHSQVVELITAGRSGNLGLADQGSNGTGAAPADTTPGAVR
jgi:D-xylose transport system ATP-binding protein